VAALAFGFMAARVVLYTAVGCHLCERAREVVEEVRRDVPFDLEEIDIGGDPALEAQYREWLPVVEIGGERAFVYFVPEAAFRARLEAQARR
jgi:glutaredoxin